MLGRLGAGIDERVDARVWQHADTWREPPRPAGAAGPLTLALVSVGVSLPATGIIATSVHDGWFVVAALLVQYAGLAAINVAFAWGRRAT